ncbi:MAG: hypothetical protein KAX84_06295 [Burkholderiales bacterium]|nr:hypothetical protein [Betaproteobacteria bacterium]MBP8295699.1 hypothetical protein [Burkholderiales bacterium]
MPALPAGGSVTITVIMVGVIPVLSPAMLGLLSLLSLLLAGLGAGWAARRK